jgi:hypothetical protein
MDRKAWESGVGAVAAAVAWLLLALPATAQSASQTILTSASGPAAGQTVLREIVDPATGDHWLLVRDPERPGAPGRLLLVPGAAREPGTGTVAELHQPVAPLVASLKPIIRGGDAVVAEESTEILEARFDAVALGPAVPGAELDVRLKVTGGVVRARAIAAGRVEIVHVEGAGR